MISRRLVPAAAALLIWSCTPVPSAAGATAQADGPETDAQFAKLIVRVKQSDPAVDFFQLRRLYRESGTFTRRDEAEDPMVAAAEAGEYESALRMARAILARNYMNMEAHLASLVACVQLGDKTCETHHRYVVQGVIRSIQGPGDGMTPRTAWVVVDSSEEYTLARAFNLEVPEQTLIKGDDGRFYDRLKVRHRETKKESLVYFNVDLSLAALRRALGIK
jgi:hypothetical protein